MLYCSIFQYTIKVCNPKYKTSFPNWRVNGNNNNLFQSFYHIILFAQHCNSHYVFIISKSLFIYICIPINLPADLQNMRGCLWHQRRIWSSQVVSFALMKPTLLENQWSGSGEWEVRVSALVLLQSQWCDGSRLGPACNVAPHFKGPKKIHKYRAIRRIVFLT